MSTLRLQFPDLPNCFVYLDFNREYTNLPNGEQFHWIKPSKVRLAYEQDNYSASLTPELGTKIDFYNLHMGRVIGTAKSSVSPNYDPERTLDGILQGAFSAVFNELKYALHLRFPNLGVFPMRVREAPPSLAFYPHLYETNEEYRQQFKAQHGQPEPERLVG